MVDDLTGRAVNGHTDTPRDHDAGATGTPGAIPHGTGTVLHEAREGPPQDERDSRGVRDTALQWSSAETFGRIPPLTYKPDYKPRNGYAPVVLDRARRDTRKGSLSRDIIASVDAFLYASLTGRIPRESMRILGGAWYKLRDARLESGQWIEVKPAAWFPAEGKEGGKRDGLAAIYMLSPAYRREIMESGQQSGHFAGQGHLKARRKLKPDHMPAASWSIPCNLREAMKRGTGLKARIDIVLAMLEKPTGFLEYPKAPAGALALFMRAARGWRILAPLYPGEELRPSWHLHDECRWLYARKPAIQQLPGVVRLNALEGLNGEPLSELDFNGCQLNIALQAKGEEYRIDPYRIVLNHLRLNSWNLDRDEVKALTIPMLHGRSRHDYLWLYRTGEVLYPVHVYDLINEVLPELRGLPLMIPQGGIMLAALVTLVEVGKAPGLPLFDSILTPYPELAEPAMKEAARRILDTSESIPLEVIHCQQLRLPLSV